MEPTRQVIVDDLIASAHAEHNGRTAEVKDAIVAALRALDAPWSEKVIESLVAAGAAKLYSDWRRRYTVAGKTKTGVKLDIPRFGAVTERDAEGTTEYRQLALELLTLDQLRERHKRLRTTRDTMSREIAFLGVLIEAMEANASLATAGDALRSLGEAA